MGISDDIVPRRRHYSHLIEEPAQSKALDFVDEEKREEKIDSYLAPTNVEEVVTDKGDDFFKSPATPSKKLHSKKKGHGKAKTIWGWILVILVLSLIGFILYKNFQDIGKLFISKVGKSNISTPNSSKSEKLETYSSEIKPQDYTTQTTSEEKTTEANTSTETKESSSSTTLAKADLKIQILNGNGITSSASTIKKILEDADFKVSSTGNAKSFAYEKTYIYYKTGKEEGAKLIETALKGRVIVLEKSDDIAKTYDIVVVVGKK